MAQIAPGTQLGGYTIRSFIGKGGMGEIWLALQTSIGREVALKLLSPKMVAKNPKFAARFIAEAQAAGRLNHPHIIGVHDVGQVDHEGTTIHYFSMEYVDGENFRQIVERDGPLDADTLGVVMAALADALAYAHGLGMIHRDIKPENVMITRDGRVKLADFGLALQVDSHEASEIERDQAGRIKVMGTPLYMSPEQARGKTLDFRSDLYALGATLFHLLTGEPPYRRANAKEVMRAHVHDGVPDPDELRRCPEHWRKLCMRLLSKHPDDRCREPDAIRDLVHRTITGTRPGRSHRRSPTAGGRSRSRGSGVKQVAALLGIVLLIGVVTIVAVGRRGMQPGANADEPPADPPSPSDPDGSDPSDARVAAAQDYLAGLPDDPLEALHRLRGPEGLRNAYFIADDAAMAVLRERERELAARLEEQEQRQRAAMMPHIDAGRAALARDDLDAARAALAEVGPADRHWVRDPWHDLEQAIAERADALIAEAIAAIEATDDLDDLVDPRDDLLAAGIERPRLAPVIDALDARREALRRAAEERARRAEERRQAQWAALTEDLAEARADDGSVPDFDTFRRHLRRAHGRLADAPHRQAQIDILSTLADRAEAVSTALDATLATDPLPFEMPLRDGSAHGTITGFSNGGFDITLPQGKMRRDIDAHEIPLGRLIAHTCDTHDLAPAAEHAAAFAWMWRLPLGVELLVDEQLIDTALTAAVAAVDPELRAARTAISADYDFSERAARSLEDFAGGTVDHADGALRFRPAALAPFTLAEQKRQPGRVLAGLREPHCDTMRWTTPFAAPAEIQLRVRLGTLGKGLFGFEQGDTRVRLFLDRQYRRSALLQTGRDDRLRFSHVVSDDRRLAEEVAVTLRIDAEGTITFLIDGREHEASGAATLDTGRPLHLVVQGLFLEDEPTPPIDLLRCTIEATRP